MSLASESKILLQYFIQKPSYLTSLIPSIPFRLIRSSNACYELTKPKICLPFNRFADPLALAGSASHISLWSDNHLQFLKSINRTQSIQVEKLILKNPFKTQKLIKDCLDFGVNTMVVDNFEQLWKIHQCRLIKNPSSFQNIPIKFVWTVSDPENDLKQIQTLKSYNIKLAGLCFDKVQTKKITDIKQFITRVNEGQSEKKQIRSIYLESESEQFDKIQEAYQTDEFFKNKIETILEKCDFKMTEKCWIAARVIGQSKRKEPILSEESYNYISAEQAKKGKIVQKEGKKWIFSPISYFPDGKVMEEHEKKGYVMNMI